MEYISIEKRGYLTIITINRPEAYNALNTAAHYELAEAFDQFAADDDQWVAILTAAGDKAFCAGHDLKQQAAGGGMETPPSGFGGMTSRFDLDKPVIAAINGIAMGGGMELALACDLVIASRDAIFALPETKVGLAPLAGAPFRLPLAVGLQRALGLLLTGRRVDAEEGYRLGFVTEVVDGNVLEAAERWAAMLLECSPLAVRATKDAVFKGLEISVEDGLKKQWCFPAVERMLKSKDFIEGPKAFAEKRKPRWLNR